MSDVELWIKLKDESTDVLVLPQGTIFSTPEGAAVFVPHGNGGYDRQGMERWIEDNRLKDEV